MVSMKLLASGTLGTEWIMLFFFSKSSAHGQEEKEDSEENMHHSILWQAFHTTNGTAWNIDGWKKDLRLKRKRAGGVDNLCRPNWLQSISLHQRAHSRLTVPCHTIKESGSCAYLSITILYNTIVEWDGDWCSVVLATAGSLLHKKYFPGLFKL